ncbi:MAG: hypothetical protein NVSMB2_12650 [Chloroflexota bacterium]
MPALDHNGGFLVSAFVITVIVLGGYALYLWSRLRGASRAAAAVTGGDQSARKVNAAAPMAATIHTPNNANGPSAA